MYVREAVAEWLTHLLVLTIFNEEAYLTFKSIYHKTLNLF